MIKYFFKNVLEKLKTTLLISIIVFLLTMGMSSVNNTNYFVFSFIIILVYLILENLYFLIKNRSYKVEHDYYRELPRNYSPSIVSFLTNLKVEYRKDVLADLIYLEQKKILKINQDKTIKILNSDYVFMDDEKHLSYLVNELALSENPSIDYLFENEKNYKDSFKKLIIEDCFSNGLLTHYSMQKFGFIMLLIVFFAIRIFSSYGIFSIQNHMFNLFNNSNMNQTEIINSFVDIQKSMNTFANVIPMLFMGFFIMMVLTKVLPIIKRINGTDYMRSNQGKKDMGLWYAYYRFLKDFSVMDERKLEEKELWGYYFAYGLSLGINKKVMKKFHLEYENIIH